MLTHCSVSGWRWFRGDAFWSRGPSPNNSVRKDEDPEGGICRWWLASCFQGASGAIDLCFLIRLLFQEISNYRSAWHLCVCVCACSAHVGPLSWQTAGRNNTTPPASVILPPLGVVQFNSNSSLMAFYELLGTACSISTTHHSTSLLRSLLQESMEWPGDSPDDRTLMAPLPPNTSSEMTTEKFLKNTKEKLNPDANRSVGRLWMSSRHHRCKVWSPFHFRWMIWRTTHDDDVFCV